jgi:predicted dehydrogenase
LAQTLKRLVEAKSEVKSFIYTVNAGHIPPDHWMQDPDIGGVRLLAEGCHFIDLLRYLAGRSIDSAYVTYTTPAGVDTRDTFSIQMTFADGSIGTVHYFANGSKSFPKERLEVFCGGGVLQLDNFRTLQGFGWKGFSKQKSGGQDKGHNTELKALVDALEQGKPAPISFDEIVEVTDVSLALVEAGEYRR